MIELYNKQQNLTSIIPVAVYSTDKDGLITYYNEKAAALWGRRPRVNDPTESLFCGSWKLYDTGGNPMPHDQCPMAVALREKTSLQNQEICIERPNGTRVSALLNIDLIPGLNGELNGAINVFHNISEKEQPDHNQSWLAAIIESSEDAIISKALDGTVTSWNKGAEKIYGYSKEEVIGKSISLIIPAFRFAEEVEILERIREGETVAHFETTRITKEGTLIDISLTVSPIKDKNGHIVGASNISRDITGTVRLKHKLEEYNRKLSELIRNKDEFIALASHELKTPTTTIKGYLQLIEDEIGQEDHKQYIQKTLKQVDKLTGLISDMLDVTKMQEGKLKMHHSTFDLHQLIADCAGSIEPDANHRIELINRPESQFITADRLRIRQVILNILSNAIKYSPRNKSIVLKSELASGNILISVQDFGLGIPVDKIEKIFTRFYRVDRTDFSSGLGIGLYIAKEVVTEHNGKIWVESEEGLGSTFYIRLPVQQ